MPFQYQTKVQLYDTDAAGILFFGHQFRMAHDAYQAYLEGCGFSFAEVLKRGEILIPIVHAEADFEQPLAVGDKLVIELTATKIAAHSFVLRYLLVNDKQDRMGSVETVHVTIDRPSGQKVELPKPLRTALEAIAS